MNQCEELWAAWPEVETDEPSEFVKAYMREMEWAFSRRAASPSRASSPFSPAIQANGGATL